MQVKDMEKPTMKVQNLSFSYGKKSGVKGYSLKYRKGNYHHFRR
mgnify:CR=1 FL=1